MSENKTVLIKCLICEEHLHIATNPAEVNKTCREHVEQRHKVRARELANLDVKVREAATKYKTLQQKFIDIMDRTFKFEQGLISSLDEADPNKIGRA